MLIFVPCLTRCISSVHKRVSHGLFVRQAAVFSAWDDETAHNQQRLAAAQLALGRRQRTVRQRMCITGWRRETESAVVLQRVSVSVLKCVVRGWCRHHRPTVQRQAHEIAR